MLTVPWVYIVYLSSQTKESRSRYKIVSFKSEQNGKWKIQVLAKARQIPNQMLTMCVQTHFFWQLNWGAIGISSWVKSIQTFHIAYILSRSALVDLQKSTEPKKIWLYPITQFTTKSPLWTLSFSQGKTFCWKAGKWYYYMLQTAIMYFSFYSRYWEGIHWICTQSLGSQGRTIWNSKPSSAI